MLDRFSFFSDLYEIVNPDIALQSAVHQRTFLKAGLAGFECPANGGVSGRLRGLCGFNPIGQVGDADQCLAEKMHIQPSKR